MPTQWLFDLGNTRLKCAPLLDDGSIGDVRALAHSEGDAGIAGLALPAGDVAFIASVAAQAMTVALLEGLTASGFKRIAIARTASQYDGVRIAYPHPQRLGVDRFLALLAARARDPSPALVVGVGTALTIDLLDAAGRHRGGRIAASPALMRQALHSRAAQLPLHGGSYGEFAEDTADALASGCEGAALALVARSLQSASDLLGAAPQLLLHGGGAEALRPHWPQAQWLPALVLQGLARWARAGA